MRFTGPSRLLSPEKKAFVYAPYDRWVKRETRPYRPLLHGLMLSTTLDELLAAPAGTVVREPKAGFNSSDLQVRLCDPTGADAPECVQLTSSTWCIFLAKDCAFLMQVRPVSFTSSSPVYPSARAACTNLRARAWRALEA